MKQRNLLRRMTALMLCLCLLCAGADAVTLADGTVVWGYSEGMALAEKDGKWGYANAAKQIVIPIQYDSAVSFNLGIAAVNKDGKLGVIRQDGKYLIQPVYDALLPVDCGLYIAQKGAKWGVVSILSFPDGVGGKTNLLYPLEYDSVQVEEQAGSQVLSLRQGDKRTVVPLFQLPALLKERGVPSAAFPLNRGRLPAFTDVSPRDWFDLWVDIAYNVGLTSGVGNNRYGPEQTLTVAEALKLAATMDSRYKDDDFHLQTTPSGSKWYRLAVDYCLASGIIKSGQFQESDYTRAVTRGEMAGILAATTLAKEIPLINSLDQIKLRVPDVTLRTPNAAAIYSLYAKGILTGVDSSLTFRPDATLTRAEMEAIVSRMARAEQRLTL